MQGSGFQESCSSRTYLSLKEGWLTMCSLARFLLLKQCVNKINLLYKILKWKLWNYYIPVCFVAKSCLFGKNHNSNHAIGDIDNCSFLRRRSVSGYRRTCDQKHRPSVGRDTKLNRSVALLLHSHSLTHVVVLKALSQKVAYITTQRNTVSLTEQLYCSPASLSCILT